MPKQKKTINDPPFYFNEDKKLWYIDQCYTHPDLGIIHIKKKWYRTKALAKADYPNVIDAAIDRRARKDDTKKFSRQLASWEDFKDVYFEGNEEAAESFKEDNPLAKSANYEIYLADVAEQDELVEYLQGLDGVREVHQSEVAARTLTDFNSLLTYISIGVIIILIAVAVFLISNTVTVGIAVRKKEIAIMKLIGATDRFVRAPFVVEGVVIGLVGSIIPLVLLYFLYKAIMSYVTDRFIALNSMVSFIPANEVFRFLIPVSILLGVGIGYVGSRFTLKRHLKV